MSLRFGAAVLLAIVAVAGRNALAHHSVGGEFDVTKMVRLNGVVSVLMMRKAGLSKALLLADAQMATVDAYPARDGTPHLGYLVKITYADGHHYQFAADK